MLSIATPRFAPFVRDANNLCVDCKSVLDTYEQHSVCLWYSVEMQTDNGSHIELKNCTEQIWIIRIDLVPDKLGPMSFEYYSESNGG